MIETGTGLALAPDPLLDSFAGITFCLRCSLLASIFLGETSETKLMASII